MKNFSLAIIVGLGGFLGAFSRYIISTFFSKIFQGNFPYGTLSVNILGALLIGFIMEFSINSPMISQHTKLFLTTGVLGGLTTFSTFSYETIKLLSSGNFLLSIQNIVLNLGCSLFFVVLGQKLSKFFI